MLLSISTTHEPATDLGYLLHKHPDRVQAFEVGFGTAYVLYPEAGPNRTTVVLLVDVDADRLARRTRRSAGQRAARTGFALTGSINDRAFAASSLLSVAIGRVFRSALAGQCASHPDLVTEPLPLEVHLPVLSCRGDVALVERLFTPLGVTVHAASIAADVRHPEWGASRFVDCRLAGTVPLAALLAQLYVLLPVLDDDKHYWVEEAEIDKLVRHGASWLATHPERDLITRRYLRHQPRLTRDALDRLVVADGDLVDTDRADEAAAAEEAAIERPLSLHQQRLDAVAAVLVEAGATRVADVGCGEGKLISRLLREPSIEHVVGFDASMRALQRAAARLHLDTMTPRQRDRVTLGQGSFLLRDERLRGVDAVAAVEVIEHVDPERLDAFVDSVLRDSRPRTVVVTTPNREHNVRFAGLPPGRLRHRDHRFEWTRAELADWAAAVSDAAGYTFEWRGIGNDDPEVGPPSQMVVFRR